MKKLPFLLLCLFCSSASAQTVKELDELRINTTDLLLGSALRASNTAPGHYFGNVGVMEEH